MATVPPTERTTFHRLPERGSTDREVAYAILDEAFVCHVGISTDAGPVVIPTLYVRDGDRLLLHGSAASRLLRTAARSTDICVTVTLIDGFVLARSAFHHSMNYRSVVVFGSARRLEDIDEHRAALDILVEGLMPGRSPDVRPPSDKEVKSTIVLELPLDELSVKVRAGGPKDDPEDMDLPTWAGVLPLKLTPGTPIPDAELAPETAAQTPTYVSGYRRRGW